MRLLLGVGRQQHDHVGLGRGVGDGQHPQPGRLGLGHRRRALAQPDPDVDARVLQVQGVRVALRAVADDGHLAALDDRPIGVGLVVDGCSHQLALPSHGAQPRALTIQLGQRHPAGALQLHDAIAAEQLLEVVELVGMPSSDTVRASVPTARILPSKIVTSSTTWLRCSGAARTVASTSSRSTDSSGIELGDLHHLDELEQLLGDLLERRRLDVDDDGEAREALVLARRDGQREDVVAPAGEQRRHPGQDARPVLDEDGQDVMSLVGPTAALIAATPASGAATAGGRGRRSSGPPAPSGTPSRRRRRGSR